MKTKKIVSLILAMVMVLSLSSVFVMATDACYVNNVISQTITGTPDMDGSVSADEYGDPIIITSQAHANANNDKLTWTKLSSPENAEQRAKIYMTYDQTYLFIAATLDHAQANQRTNSGGGYHPHLAVTLSQKSGSGVFKSNGHEVYLFSRVAYKGKVGSFTPDFFSARYRADMASNGANTTLSQITGTSGMDYFVAYDEQTQTYTYEMRILWANAPGLKDTETNKYNGSDFAMAIELADGSLGDDRAPSYYQIGGNAAQQDKFNKTANPHGENVVTFASVGQFRVMDSVAPMPDVAPDPNGMVEEGEYGDPIIITSQKHATKVTDDQISWTEKKTTANSAQQAKIYMTNDAEYLYIAATLDNATKDLWTSAGSGGNHPHLAITASKLDGTGVLKDGDAEKYLFSRVHLGNECKEVQIWAQEKPTNTNRNPAYGATFKDNIYYFEMRIPWTAVPGMTDSKGFYTGDSLAMTIELADGVAENKQLEGSYYSIGGTAARQGNWNSAAGNPHGENVMAISCNTFFANDVDMVSGTVYSFMNADTGREIAVGDTAEFKAVRVGEDSWYFMVGEQYLDLTDNAPALRSTPVKYMLNKMANERYQIFVNNTVLLDTDGGEDTAVTLGHAGVNERGIASGWYITASGQEKPLRILPIGDSITYGYTPGGHNFAWRDELSKDLMNEFGRVVFVGSVAEVWTSIQAQSLYRHEGHSGWTIDRELAKRDDGEGKNDPTGTETMSLHEIATSTVQKYDPDVVLMMAGINDVAWLGGNNANGSEATTEELIALHEEYKVLVRELAANMDEGDIIFCSTLTPAPREDLVGAEVKFNDLLAGTVGDLNSELSCAVRINDNYAAFGGSYDGVSSDELHLNHDGDAKVAAQYKASILSMYNTDSSVKTVVVTTANLASTLENAANGAIIVLGEDIAVDSLMVPANVTLDLNGKTLTVTEFNAYGDVVDTTLGQGGIAVVGDEPFFNLQKDNSMIALFDEGFGYRFFSYKFDYKAVETGDEDSVKFAIRLDLPTADAYALLDDEANYDTFFIKLNLSNLEGACPPIDYVFKKDTMKTYVERSSADVTKKYGITLTVYGMSSLATKDYTFDGAEACLTFANVTLQNAYN